MDRQAEQIADEVAEDLSLLFIAGCQADCALNLTDVTIADQVAKEGADALVNHRRNRDTFAQRHWRPKDSVCCFVLCHQRRQSCIVPCPLALTEAHYSPTRYTSVVSNRLQSRPDYGSPIKRNILL